MIESYYWRVELRSDLAWLQEHRKYRRWSEKQQVLFERKLMLVAFQVRSLLERPKVNDRARNETISVVRFKKVGDRPFTATGAGWPHERFEMERPEPDFLSAPEVCNQLIHYYWMQTYIEGKAFVSMLVFSDFKRNKWAYEIQIEDLLRLFGVFGDDSSSVVEAEWKWSNKRQDFVVTKALGPSDPRTDRWSEGSLENLDKLPT
ncbi:hypothetical protein [Paraburkholderia terricola]|uniref:Uncharacterized protein n=1 Tax=Paraburkholderia terricola TaxID=169427 RepID=A0ABU1LXX7_9BURK|nr:hypothetical protein [Paraburkholderia terricola]MDR6411390.1 hypothetical protein [Paraburkholderia terricola]MDR6483370.1 hypothetical protein [Paraburkholderia terricola]